MQIPILLLSPPQLSSPPPALSSSSTTLLLRCSPAPPLSIPPPLLSSVFPPPGTGIGLSSANLSPKLYKRSIRHQTQKGRIDVRSTLVWVWQSRSNQDFVLVASPMSSMCEYLSGRCCGGGRGGQTLDNMPQKRPNSGHSPNKCTHQVWISVILWPLEGQNLWPKSESMVDTHPISMHTKFELDCVNTFSDNGRKPQFSVILWPLGGENRTKIAQKRIISEHQY